MNTIVSGKYAVSHIKLHSVDYGKLKCHSCDWELPLDEIDRSVLKTRNILDAFEAEAEDHLHLHHAKDLKDLIEAQAIEKELK